MNSFSKNSSFFWYRFCRCKNEKKIGPLYVKSIPAFSSAAGGVFSNCSFPKQTQGKHFSVLALDNIQNGVSKSGQSFITNFYREMLCILNVIFMQ